MNKIDELTKNPDRRAFIKYLLGGIAVGIPTITLLQGCGMPGDPIENLYTKDVMPGSKDVYDVGSETYRYAEGHFKKIILNGVELTGGGDMTKAVYDTDDDGIIDEAAIPVNTGMIWAIVFGG